MRYPAGSKIIRFPSGGYTLVDSDLHEFLSQFSWYLHRSRGGVYARATIWGEKVFMHRLILSVVAKIDIQDYQVDHNNRNTLDNRLCNLSLVTPEENVANRRYRKTGRGAE